MVFLLSVVLLSTLNDTLSARKKNWNLGVAWTQGVGFWVAKCYLPSKGLMSVSLPSVKSLPPCTVSWGWKKKIPLVHMSRGQSEISIHVSFLRQTACCSGWCPLPNLLPKLHLVPNPQPAAQVAAKPAAEEPIPVTPVEQVQLFKVKYSRQKKWHTEPVYPNRQFPGPNGNYRHAYSQAEGVHHAIR
jgi:hypothetical protein